MKILIFIFTLFLLPISASACSYIYQTPQESFNENPYVFIAKIADLENIGGLNGSRIVTFDILKTYKGDIEEEITLKTGANSALCGFDDGILVEGDVWVIHTSSLENFNSLPVNKKYKLFEDAEKTIDILANRPTMCTLEYAPVCGRIDTGIRCITTPCNSYIEKTYGNSCQLQVAGAEFLYKGECKNVIIKDDEVKIETPQDKENTPTENPTDDHQTDDNSKNVEKKSFIQKIIDFFKRIFSF